VEARPLLLGAGRDAGGSPGQGDVGWRGGRLRDLKATFAANGEAIQHLQQGAPLRFTTAGDQQRTFLSENRGQGLVDPKRRVRKGGFLQELRP
jgi:hypothetical protein